MIRPTCIRSETAAALSVEPPQELAPLVAPSTIRSRLIRLLAEPETRLIMRADRVDEAELLAMLIATSAKLLRRKIQLTPSEGDA